MESLSYVLLGKPAIKAGFFNARSNQETSLLMRHLKHIYVAFLEQQHFSIQS
jgi:hypothetical protein